MHSPLAVMVGLIAAVSPATLLPLRPGDYVLAGQSCRDAPFAAETSFDGRAFSDPHASDCASAVLRKRGDLYDVRTTCKALGDGTPTAPSTIVERYRLLSPTRFEKRGSAGALTYRWCRPR